MAHGLNAYFEHAKELTYIDKYPKSIIELEQIRGKTIAEVGAGTLNDIAWLVRNGYTDLEHFLICEPHIPAFVHALDKIDEIFGEHSAVRHRNQLVCRPFPTKQLPCDAADFVYANNTLHSMNYESLEEELDRRAWEAGAHPEYIMPKAPLQKVRDAVGDAYRVLRQGGVFFGRNLSNHIDEANYIRLNAKDNKSEDDLFALWTADAVKDGTLIGLDPGAFSDMARQVGFVNTYVEEEKRHPERPRINFYFRFEK